VAIVSKRSRYALHGLGYLAKFSEGKPISFDEILVYLRAYSQHLSLSPGYIAKIFQDISRAGFTVAVSGPHGGYQL
jgi:DNA-binding IscR family transcriptional regulator